MIELCYVVLQQGSVAHSSLPGCCWHEVDITLPVVIVSFKNDIEKSEQDAHGLVRGYNSA